MLATEQFGDIKIGRFKIPGFDTIPNGPDTWGRHMDYGVSTGVEAYVRNHKGYKPFLAVAGFMDPQTTELLKDF